MSTPIDLRAEFGAKWRIELDPAARGRWSDPWNYKVACRHGHLFPVSDCLIGVATDRPGVIVRKLRSIDGLEVVADGDDGVNAVFPRDCIQAVARVMKPRRRRQVTAAQAAALAQGRLRRKASA